LKIVGSRSRAFQNTRVRPFRAEPPQNHGKLLTSFGKIEQTG
jgi:hypothetical protein